jgi:hypothetical protein
MTSLVCGRSGLRLVGHHPIEAAVGVREEPVRRQPFKDHDTSLSHMQSTQHQFLGVHRPIQIVVRGHFVEPRDNIEHELVRVVNLDDSGVACQVQRRTRSRTPCEQARFSSTLPS